MARKRSKPAILAGLLAKARAKALEDDRALVARLQAQVEQDRAGNVTMLNDLSRPDRGQEGRGVVTTEDGATKPG